MTPPYSEEVKSGWDLEKELGGAACPVVPETPAEPTEPSNGRGAGHALSSKAVSPFPSCLAQAMELLVQKALSSAMGPLSPGDPV